jgi:hypothetical protein
VAPSMGQACRHAGCVGSNSPSGLGRPPKTLAGNILCILTNCGFVQNRHQYGTTCYTSYGSDMRYGSGGSAKTFEMHMPYRQSSQVLSTHLP